MNGEARRDNVPRHEGAQIAAPSGPVSHAPSTSEIAALREAAMRGEPDRYLAATLAPRPLQSALIAIAAFAADVGRIPASVSEPMLGDIRLQWWRDALRIDAGGAEQGEMHDSQPSGHPVADAIVAATRRHQLDMRHLAGLIDARELDLSGGLPADDAGLLTYLDRTEGDAFRLALQVVGVGPDDAGGLATVAGRAYGLARALGRLPMLRHNGGLPLPADRLTRAGISPDALGGDPVAAEVAAAVEAVAEDLRGIARLALDEARAGMRRFPRQVRVALLPLAMVEPYLRAQSGGESLGSMVTVSPLTRIVRIGLAHVTGRV